MATEMAKVLLRTPKTNVDAAQAYADKHGISRTAAINIALARGLATMTEKPTNQRTEEYR
jgi:hypothetical protein